MLFGFTILVVNTQNGIVVCSLIIITSKMNKDFETI